MDAGGVARQHRAQDAALPAVGDGAAVLDAETPVEYLPVEAASETAQHGLHLGQNEADLLHVASAHGLGQPRCRGQLAQIFVGPLGIVAERQLILGEAARRVGAEGHQLGGGQAVERPPGLLASEVPGDEARIGVADFDDRLAGAQIGDSDGAQTAVGGAGAEERDLEHQ